VFSAETNLPIHVFAARGFIAVDYWDATPLSAIQPVFRE
jgi:hypothetical protein